MRKHSLIVMAVCVGWLSVSHSSNALAQAPTIEVRNAASYAAQVAPSSVAAAFFSQPAISLSCAQTTPLPTTLSGASLEINGRAAGLLCVGATQINLVVPEQTALGNATVSLRLNGTVVASGNVLVHAIAPGIFSANGNGQGVPAAFFLRGSPSPVLVYKFEGGRFVPTAIDLCANADEVVLVLFLTGIRLAADPNRDGNVNETLQIVIGNRSLPLAYAGKQGDFVGLDQVNLVLPSDLANRGLTTLTLTAPGNTSSNSVELDFSTTGALRVEKFDPSSVLAGQQVAINGVGFSASPDKNIVRIFGTNGQADAQVVDATPTQLTIFVPYGAESGLLSVTNLDSRCAAGLSLTPLTLKTSLSGFFKNTTGEKIKGIRVEVRDAAGAVKTTETNDEGVFVVGDLSPGSADVKLDTSRVPTALPYPNLTFKVRIAPGRDNQLPFPGSLQVADGTTGSLHGDGSLTDDWYKTTEPNGRIVTGKAILDIPDNATIRFPDGASAGRVTLSLVNRSLPPVELPERHFSSTIVQITPIGATISPGAKLTLPNSDGLPAGAAVQLFSLDQRPSSQTLGQFVVSGMATVSSDGQRIETAANTITQTTLYFASLMRPTITVIGNVEESSRLPVSNALIGSRGQGRVTDGTGGFIVRNVPVNSLPAQMVEGQVVHINRQGVAVVGDELIAVEANYLRPTQIVSRAENNEVQPGTGNVTSAGTLILEAPPTDNPPTILAGGVANIRLLAGRSERLSLIVNKGGGQSVQVSVTGASFVSIRPDQGNVYFLEMTPGLNDKGTYALVITARNDRGRSAIQRLSLLVE